MSFIWIWTRSKHSSTIWRMLNSFFSCLNLPYLIKKKSSVSWTSVTKCSVDILAIRSHSNMCISSVFCSIRSTMLRIELRGVFMSWEVEAIIMSVNYSYALALSAFTSSVTSMIIVSTHFYSKNTISFYLTSNILITEDS